jgi:dynein light chain Tctex-type 1
VYFFSSLRLQAAAARRLPAAWQPVMSDDAEEFQVEDVEGIVKTSLQSSISQESRYDPETANTTSRTLLEACIKNLAALGKPFKYIVTAIVMQKNGAGLHTAMGAYWDARKDGAWSAAGCPPPPPYPSPPPSTGG